MRPEDVIPQSVALACKFRTIVAVRGREPAIRLGCKNPELLAMSASTDGGVVVDGDVCRICRHHELRQARQKSVEDGDGFGFIEQVTVQEGHGDAT